MILSLDVFLQGSTTKGKEKKVTINNDISPMCRCSCLGPTKVKATTPMVSYADHVDGTSVFVGGSVYEFGGNGVHRVAGVC